MTRTYTDLQPLETDRTRWTVVHALRARVAATPGSTFLIVPDEGREWTYSEALADADRVAGGLLEAGAGSGDRVVVMASNSSQFVLTWLACGLAHLVEVPINTAYEGQFLVHQVGLTAARFAVIDDTFAERLASARDQLPELDALWVIDKGNCAAALTVLRGCGWRAEPWTRLLAAGAAGLPEPGASELAAIFFTSGTTGPSKGVAMPHSQMYFFGQEVVSLTRLTDQDTYLTLTPLFHGNAQFMAAYPALIAGARVVVRTKFSATRWIDHVREHGVTVTNLIGVMMDFVWKQAARPDDSDNKLRCVYSAPTPSSILEPFMTRFGVEAFVDAFGLTETCAPILSPYGQLRPAGAAGLLASDWFEARLVDPATDEEVPSGEIGELVVRYKYPWTCSLGYYAMPDKTAEAWRNLWFHTGDALRRDENGWYYFVDRYKDALRRRGENISSYEIEQVILGHPAIAECAVIGVAAGIDAGEDEVMAVVTPAGQISADEIWHWCTGRIPDFAVPRFIRIADKLPKTPSEKIQKARLRSDGITAGTRDRLARPPQDVVTGRRPQ